MNNKLLSLITRLKEGEFSSPEQQQQIIDELKGEVLSFFPDNQEYIMLINDLDYNILSEVVLHLFKSLDLNEERYQLLAMVMANKASDAQSETQRIIELLSKFIEDDNFLGAQQILEEIANLYTNSGKKLVPVRIAKPLAKIYEQSASVFTAVKHTDFINPETAFMFNLSIGIAGNTSKPVMVTLDELFSANVQLVIEYNKTDAKRVEKWIQKQPGGFQEQYNISIGRPPASISLPERINVHSCLKGLAEYVQQQEQKEAHLLKKLSNLSQELAIEKSSNNRLFEQLSLTKEEKRQALTEIDLLTKECETLQAEILHLEQLSKKQITEYEDKIQTISELVKLEALSKVNDFKGKLSDLLKVEFDDLTMVLDEEMTPELGNNLREQLKSIFRLLDREGIICGE